MLSIIFLFIFFIVDICLKDYSSPLYIENKKFPARDLAQFFAPFDLTPEGKVEEPKWNSIIIVLKQIHRPSMDGN